MDGLNAIAALRRPMRRSAFSFMMKNMPADATSNRAALPSILERQVTELLGTRPIHARVVGGGMTAARRWIVGFDNGTRAFLKAAGNPATATWLRREYKIYQSFTATYLPKVIGWS